MPIVAVGKRSELFFVVKKSTLFSRSNRRARNTLLQTYYFFLSRKGPTSHFAHGNNFQLWNPNPLFRTGRITMRYFDEELSIIVM